MSWSVGMRTSAAIAVLAVGALLSGCDQAPPAQAAAAAPPPPPVEVAAPLVRSIVEWDEFTGRFAAAERVDMRARVSGYLQEAHFQDGQIVQKGDLLFTIDQRPFQAELARARAEVASAQSRLSLSERELSRAERLVASKAISEEAADNRRSARAQAAADLQAARAGAAIAELNLQFTEIRSPVSGRISDRKVDVGNLVTGGDGATLLATIVALDPIHLEFTMSEADFLKYGRLHSDGVRASARDGAHAIYARLMDEAGWPHEGVMDFLDNTLDAASGTIRARAVFANPDLQLTPGTFARIRMAGSGRYDATMVPDAAIVSDQANKIVMTVDAEGTVVPRQVTLGPVVDGLRVVRSGLDPAADRIVVKGLQRARPGGKVTVESTTIQAKAGASTAGG